MVSGEAMLWAILLQLLVLKDRADERALQLAWVGSEGRSRGGRRLQCSDDALTCRLGGCAALPPLGLVPSSFNLHRECLGCLGPARADPSGETAFCKKPAQPYLVLGQGALSCLNLNPPGMRCPAS